MSLCRIMSFSVSEIEEVVVNATSYYHNGDTIVNTYEIEYLKEHRYRMLPSILDDEEKKYLSAVIKPFRSRVRSITKKHTNRNMDYISMDVVNEVDSSYVDTVELPVFKEGRMYKNMIRKITYTLEELGL